MGFFEDSYQHNLSNNNNVRWEYEEICLTMNNTVVFNTLGNQGWELCGYDANAGRAIFKRIKR